MTEASRIAPGARVRIACTVNGVRQQGYAESRTLLCDFLRHELNLYGTHVGCEHGVCGACTVTLDGRLARSCMTLAVQADGAEIGTIEGLSGNGGLSALQKAFSEHGALQCGFCTPGVLISATRFLRDNADPTAGEVRVMLSGHLCRCTGYEGMVRAILAVARKRRTA